MLFVSLFKAARTTLFSVAREIYKLLWHIPEDLARFKSLTSGGTVIMGRKTWESLPLRPLPSRQNVVISRQAEVVEAKTVRSVEEALSRFPDSWFIGGSEIYDLFLPHAEMIYRTVVGKVYGEADAFAPKGGGKQSSGLPKRNLSC